MFEPTIRPLSARNWNDLESLFGPRGACAGCWCMYWRCHRAEFNRNLGDANRLALKRLTDQGEPLGLLASQEDQPIGWMAVAPRIAYPTLERSRILKRVDDLPVWSITCFYIPAKYRGQGLMRALIDASKLYVQDNGGSTIEGYPIIPAKPRIAPTSAYTGIYQVFMEAGFREVARIRDSRPILRYSIPNSPRR